MEANIIVISRLFNKSGSAETVNLGGKSVKIPKLTPAKYKALFDRIETLPQIIASILASRNSGQFTQTAIIGVGIALDEIIAVVAELAELDAEYIANNADLNEITTFVRLTLEKNDLHQTLKNCQAVLAAILPKALGAAPDGN